MINYQNLFDALLNDGMQDPPFEEHHNDNSFISSDPHKLIERFPRGNTPLGVAEDPSYQSTIRGDYCAFIYENEDGVRCWCHMWSGTRALLILNLKEILSGR